MLSKCPVCGRPYNIFDRIAQPPMCIPCAQSGAKDPNYDPIVAAAESDVFWGRAMAAGAVALMLVLIFVPSREGASPRGKVYLWGAAIALLGAGMKKAVSAGKTLEKLKKRPNPTAEPSPPSRGGST